MNDLRPRATARYPKSIGELSRPPVSDELRSPGTKPRNASIVIIGLAIGIAGALATSRLIRTVLYAVAPNDAPTFVAVAAGLLGTAALASYLPARRALRVDPVQALRKV